MVPSVSSGLLAATLLLGQTTDVQIIQQQPSTGRTSIFGGFGSTTYQQQPQQQQQQSSRPFFSWFSREDRPVMSRFQGWFSNGRNNRDQQQQQEPPLQSPYIPQRGSPIFEGTPASNPGLYPATPTPLEFPKRMPSPSSQGLPRQAPIASQTAEPLEQTNLQVTPPAPAGKSPILSQIANKIGRDEQFAWITGQLEMENGGYVIYYATPDTVDMYHGRIAIQPGKVDMSSFRRGDLVSVRGEVMQRQAGRGAVAVYRATDVHLIERVK